MRQRERTATALRWPAAQMVLRPHRDVHRGDLRQLQQPVQVLGVRCRLPVTPPQLMGLMQSAQQPGAAATVSLPGAQSPAPTGGVPNASFPVRFPPAASVTDTAGPLPGSTTTATR